MDPTYLQPVLAGDLNLVDLISCILVQGIATTYNLLFIQIHGLHPDLQGLEKHTHCCYSEIESNHDHCPIESIFWESPCVFQMQLEYVTVVLYATSRKTKLICNLLAPFKYNITWGVQFLY